MSGAALVEERLFAAAGNLHAPHLIDIEMVQVLRPGGERRTGSGKGLESPDGTRACGGAIASMIL